MKKVSVIIPVYNCEEYLKCCLESIEKQTIGLENMEVIIINDGSTDNSLEIAKHFKKEHPNWILVDRENKGLSNSRNEGINLSTGEYVMFLDSDDYLVEETLKEMHEKASINKLDIVVGRLNGFDENNEYGYYSDKLISKERIFSFEKYKRFIKTISVCGKLYRRELIKDIKFMPNTKHEDNYFTLTCYKNASSIMTIPKYYYYRRYRSGENPSIMQTLSIASFSDLVKNFSYYFKENAKDKFIIKFSIRTFDNYIISRIKEEDKKKARIIVKDYLKNIFVSEKISRCEFIAFMRYNNIYYFLASIYYNLFKKSSY